MEKDKLKDMTMAELSAYHDLKRKRYVELEKERLSNCEMLNDVEMELGKRLLVGRIKDDIVKDGISGYIKINEVKSVSRVYDGLAYDVTADVFAEVNTNRTCCDRQLFGYEYETYLSVRVENPTTLPCYFFSPSDEEEINKKLESDAIVIEKLKTLLVDRNGHEVHRGSPVTFVNDGELENGEVVDFDIESELFTISYPFCSQNPETTKVPSSKFTVRTY